MRLLVALADVFLDFRMKALSANDEEKTLVLDGLATRVVELK